MKVWGSVTLSFVLVTVAACAAATSGDGPGGDDGGPVTTQTNLDAAVDGSSKVTLPDGSLPDTGFAIPDSMSTFIDVGTDADDTSDSGSGTGTGSSTILSGSSGSDAGSGTGTGSSTGSATGTGSTGTTTPSNSSSSSTSSSSSSSGGGDTPVCANTSAQAIEAGAALMEDDPPYCATSSPQCSTPGDCQYTAIPFTCVCVAINPL